MRGCDEGNMRRKDFSNRGSSNTLLILLFGIMVLVLLALIAKQASEGSRTKNESETNNGGGFKEIHIVATITPEPIEYIDFDLDKLAITGRDVKDDGCKTSEYQSENLGDTGRDIEMPEGIGKYDTGDGAGSESDDSSAVGSEEMPVGYEPSTGGYPEEPVGLEDGEESADTVPEHGEGSLPELVEPESDNEAGLQGSVENEYEQPIEESDEHNDSGVDEQGQSGSGEPDDSGNGDTNLTDWVYYGNCRITHYDTGACCCGVYATGYTASGTLATVGRTVATGEDLPFGTEIMINGQVYIVEDRGVDPYCVDILVPDHETALAMGMYYTDVYVRYTE